MEDRAPVPAEMCRGKSYWEGRSLIETEKKINPKSPLMKTGHSMNFFFRPGERPNPLGTGANYPVTVNEVVTCEKTAVSDGV